MHLLATLQNQYGKLADYLQLVRFDEPIGTYLLLWPTLWAVAIASNGAPDAWILFVFVAGTFLMRSAGCAINDFADRDIDRHVARTRDRPLTSGRLTVTEVLVAFSLLSLLAFGLVLTLDRQTILLSLVAVVLAGSYPFMKRFHHLPQVHLGAAFSFGIPMAFSALAGGVSQQGWLLYVAAVIWTVAYDTMYAMADREDDLKIGVKSTAILFGEFDRLMVGLFQAVFLLALILVGRDLDMGGWYYLGLFAAAVMMAYEQFLIADRNPMHCFQAFLHNHWVGAAIFAGIMAHYFAA